MVITIEIDEDQCCGAGTCVLRAPEVFDQNDEDGTVILLQKHPDQSQARQVGEAAGMCPAAAIVVRQD